MSEASLSTVIDGITCFHPDKLHEYESYPEFGHELGEESQTLSFWDLSRFRILIYELQILASEFPSPRMLEIGCGNAAFLNSLQGKLKLDLTGSELHLRALQEAKKKNPDLRLIQLDATDIPFQNEYEMIGAFDVLEHIVDDLAVLRGIYRGLIPGGYLILTVPQHPFLWSSIDVMVCHQRRYTRATMLNAVQSAGFEIRYVSSFVFFLFPFMLLSRVFERGASAQTQSKDEFEKKIRFGPVLNTLLDYAMRIDEWMLRHRWSLPFGGTLMLVAQKPLNIISRYE